MVSFGRILNDTTHTHFAARRQEVGFPLSAIEKKGEIRNVLSGLRLW